MPTAKNYKKGDYIADPGGVYVIKNIEEKENFEGEKEDFLVYKPCFNTRKKSNLIGSIPIKSIKKTNKRKVISQKQVKNILKSLKCCKASDSLIDKPDKVFIDNKLEDIANLTNELFFKKNFSDDNFSSSKEILYEKTIHRLSEEIAVVLDIDLDDAKEKILKNLQKQKISQN